MINIINKTKAYMRDFKEIMARTQTTDFFIACKESRIESNTNFYGCFYLGPFDDSLTQTLANDLRRTLLSELTGLAITSVEIEGVLHKFSNLPGMKESVLDLICNLQNVVLKKQDVSSAQITLRPTKKTYTGFLTARGPRVIKAMDLKLPAGLQCVDPNQYIVTLAEDGFLNMKFNINEGKNYIKQKPQNLDVNVLKKRNILIQNFKKTQSTNKTKQIKNLTTNKSEMESLRKNSEGLSLRGNPIPLDAVFMPVTKINCIIEENNIYSDFATDPINFSNIETDIKKMNFDNAQSRFNQKGSPGFNFKAFLNAMDSKLIYQTYLNLQNIQTGFKLIPWQTNTLYFNVNQQNLVNTQQNVSSSESIKSYISETDTKLWNSFSKVKNFLATKNLNKKHQELTRPKNSNRVLEIKGAQFTGNQIQPTSEHKLELLKNILKNQKTYNSFTINPMNGSWPQQNLKLEYFKNLKLKPLRKKSHLIVEIWTNGSLHPRQALSRSFIFLSNNFLKLQTVKIIGSRFKSELAYGNLKYSLVNNYNESFSQKNVKNKKIHLGQLNVSTTRHFTKVNRVPHFTTFNQTKTLTQNVLTQPKSYDLAFNNSRRNLVSQDQLFLANQISSKTFYLQNSLKAPVGMLNISLRAYTALKKNHIFTLNELINISKEDLLKIPNIGVKTLNEIEFSLAELGLHLKQTN